MCFKLRCLHTLLLPLIFLLIQDCTFRKTVFINDVFTNPVIDYSRYNKIAVFTLGQSDEVKEIGLNTLFTELLEKELTQEGYDVVTGDSLDPLLDGLKSRSQDSAGIDTAHRIKNEFQVSAILKGEIETYHIRRELKHGTVRSRGRQLDPNPAHDKADIRIYVGNISLRLEMIELEEASNIWSCSVSFKDYKSDENGEKMIKKILRKCLDTLPKPTHGI